MDEEMHSLLKNHTWDVVPLPFGKTAVGCKWVHTKKHHADGTLERYKSRLVARGFTQSYGIDYFETFAPVAKMETVRLLLALAAHFEWVIRQFDVKNAFLHGDLTEEVYMQPPPGYSLGPPGTVCRLRKSLYGLKQSPRMWFGRFSSVMKAEGYVHSNGDSSLFVRHCPAGVSILVVYVDDILITGSDVTEASRLSAALARAFEIKALGPLRYFLGLEVAYSSRGIFVSQQHYTVDLLKLTGMTDCAPVRTPIDPNVKLGDGGDSPPVNHYRYQQLVGKLIYLTHTRPDISFAVHLLSQFMHAPHEIHRQAAHRVLAYLKGCPGKGLHFPRSEDETVKVYTDADFAGSIVDCRSTTGYCTFVFGSLVSGKAASRTACLVLAPRQSIVPLLMGPLRLNGSMAFSLTCVSGILVRSTSSATINLLLLWPRILVKRVESSTWSVTVSSSRNAWMMAYLISSSSRHRSRLQMFSPKGCLIRSYLVLCPSSAWMTSILRLRGGVSDISFSYLCI